MSENILVLTKFHLPFYINIANFQYGEGEHITCHHPKAPAKRSNIFVQHRVGRTCFTV